MIDAEKKEKNESLLDKFMKEVSELHPSKLAISDVNHTESRKENFYVLHIDRLSEKRWSHIRLRLLHEEAYANGLWLTWC